jgi:hypothetical protein
MSNITTNPSIDSSLVAYSTKKGELKSISAEGALFKGGDALKALKNAALDLALLKAGHGKYRAASDILATAFPRTEKAFLTLYPTSQPWDNKAKFTAFVDACIVAQAPKNGWNKKQAEARVLLAALSRMVSAESVDAGEVVGAAE